MGFKISVPVWFDGNDAFLNGELFGVDSASQVIGVVPKPTGPSVPPFTTSFTVNTLYVKDPVYGGLYLAMTLAQWQAAIRVASNTAASTNIISRNFYITSPTTTITDPDFIDANILEIWQGGIQLDTTTIDLTGDTLTFPYTLQDGVVNVLFETP